MNEKGETRAIFWGPFDEDFLHLSARLRTEGVTLRRVDTLEELHEAILEESPHVVFAHLGHTQEEPVKLFYLLEVTSGKPPVILLASEQEIPLYLEGMRRGAFDCVGLPLDEQELQRILLRALKEKVQLEVLVAGHR